MNKRNRFVPVFACMLYVGHVSTVHAQPAVDPPSKSTLEEPPVPTKEARDEALRHFQKGLELLDAGAFAPALDAFQRSREFYAGKGSLQNIAVCLRELHRYDAAADTYEQLLRFPNLTPDERRSAQQYLAEMRIRVGTIEISGAEIGAAITVDGQAKGEFPPPDPVRTSTGTHVLRLYKEDFEPYEINVDVSGGKNTPVTVKMKPLRSSGRLRVVEQTGRSIDVVIDGSIIGKTPWEGRVGLGRHTVMLMGPGALGTQPASVKIKPDGLEVMTLHAKDLDAALFVQPSPIDAKVSIDGVEIGIGPWSGRLEAGPHRIDVYKEGYFSETRPLTIPTGARPTVKISLEKDSNAVIWKAPPKFAFDVGLGASLAAPFGGDIFDTSCQQGCRRGLGWGLLPRVALAYERRSAFVVGVDAGYWYAKESVQNRTISLQPKGLTSQQGRANDTIRIHGPFVGALLGYRGTVNKDRPWGFRVGGGVLFAYVRDDRTSRDFVSHQNNIGDASDINVTTNHPLSIYGYVAPDVSVALGRWKRTELDVVLGGFFALTPEPPRFSDDLPLPSTVTVTSDNGAPPRQTITTFNPETLTGQVLISGSLGLRLRYDVAL